MQGDVLTITSSGMSGYGGSGAAPGATTGSYGASSPQGQHADQGYGGPAAAIGATPGAYGTSSSERQYPDQQPLSSAQEPRGHDSTGSGLGDSKGQSGFARRSPPLQYAGTGSAEYSPDDEPSSGRHQTSHTGQSKPLTHGDTTAAGTRQAPDYSNNPEYAGGPGQSDQGLQSGTTSSSATGGSEKKGGLMGFLHRDNPNKLHKDPPSQE